VIVILVEFAGDEIALVFLTDEDGGTGLGILLEEVANSLPEAIDALADILGTQEFEACGNGVGVGVGLGVVGGDGFDLLVFKGGRRVDGWGGGFGCTVSGGGG